MGRPRHSHAIPAAPEYVGDWPAVEDELLKTLPPVLRAVVRALGFGRAREWLNEHGGVNVTLPSRRTYAQGLEPDELARMRVTLAPHTDDAGRCWMPKADKLFIRVRDAHIRKERNVVSISNLARRHRLSSRQILNICREDDRQLDLF